MRKKGFTLVELMIVIAIISILATIIIPKMGQSRAKAQLSACIGNLRSVGTALEMYANDNYHLYPNTGGISSSCVLATQGYLKRDARCPVTNDTYWLATSSGNTNCYCACGTVGSHAVMGLPNYYPRYVPNRGVITGP